MAKGFGAALVMFVAGWLAPVQAQLNMQWKFEKGDIFYMEDVQSMKMTLNQFGNTQRIESDTTTLTKFQVLDKMPDGSIVFERRVESMKVKLTPPPSAEDTKKQDEMMKQMEGVTFKITLKPSLEVSKIEGLNEFVDRIVKANPESGEQFRMMFSEENLKATINDSFASLPGKAVKPGDKWTRKSSFPMPPIGNLVADSSFVFDGPQDGLQKVSFKGNVMFQPAKDAPAGGVPGVQNQKTDFKPEGLHGTLFFDSARGRVSRTETKMRGKMTMTGSLGGQSFERIMDIDMTTLSRVMDKKP